MKRLSILPASFFLGFLLNVSAWSQSTTPAPDSAPLARRAVPADNVPVPSDGMEFSRLVWNSGATSAASAVRQRLDQQRRPLDEQAPPAIDTTLAPAPGRSKMFAAGILATLPTAGISGILNLGPRTAVQGLLGMFIGGVRTATGRYLYYFRETTNFQPYALGEVGIWGYENQLALGFGAGGGVEYFIERYPWVSLNLEFALRHVGFDESEYTISGLAFGGGLHYYF